MAPTNEFVFVKIIFLRFSHVGVRLEVEIIRTTLNNNICLMNLRESDGDQTSGSQYHADNLTGSGE